MPSWTVVVSIFVVNLLDETAAVLKCCDVVISGDTGPAHIAVAVGTPVIGLYGPTYPPAVVLMDILTIY